MANQRNPNDPYDPYRSGLSDDNFDRPQRLDSDLQLDPELRESRASTSKVTLFAVALALVLGAIFYGLNNTSVKEAQITPPAQTAQKDSQAAPPSNTGPGMTTGSAANRLTLPQTAPPANNKQ